MVIVILHNFATEISILNQINIFQKLHTHVLLDNSDQVVTQLHEKASKTQDYKIITKVIDS